MWWTSDSKQFLKYYISANTCLNHLKLGIRKLQDIMQKIFGKIGCQSDDVGFRPFNEYHEIRHNSAITRQNQLEFWNQKAKQGFL